MNIRNTKTRNVTGFGRNDMVLTIMQTPDIYFDVFSDRAS
jgi:hypothetical protein